jgi:hypothetical protein
LHSKHVEALDFLRVSIYILFLIKRYRIPLIVKLFSSPILIIFK